MTTSDGGSKVSKISFRTMECVELYLPKKLEIVSKAYAYLRELIDPEPGRGREGEINVTGFSVYELDGAFRGERLWEERTLVVRILITKHDHPESEIDSFIDRIGHEIIEAVATSEQEVWICRYEQRLSSFGRMEK